MKGMKKTLALTLAAVFAFTLLAGCAPAAAPAATTAPAATEAAATATPEAAANPGASPAEGDGYTVKFAPFISYTGLGTALGFQKGFFAENGLKVETVNLDDKVSGLISGDIDFADLNTSQAITAAAKGAPFKIVGSMFRTKGAFYLLGGKGIDSVADLKGKVVGIAAAGSGLEAYTRVILQKNGLDPDKDVTLVANGVYQQAYASLQNGQVAATIIHQPFVALAESKGEGKLLAKGYEYLPTFNTGVLVASDKFIAEHPDDLKKIIAAYFKSWTYAKEHLDETVAFGADYVQVDAAVLKTALESELGIWANDPKVDLSTLNDTQDVQIQLGFQKEKYDASKFVDQRFIPQQ